MGTATAGQNERQVAPPAARYGRPMPGCVAGGWRVGWDGDTAGGGVHVPGGGTLLAHKAACSVHILGPKNGFKKRALLVVKERSDLVALVKRHVASCQPLTGSGEEEEEEEEEEWVESAGETLVFDVV